jgi:hypothetical protein
MTSTQTDRQDIRAYVLGLTDSTTVADAVARAFETAVRKIDAPAPVKGKRLPDYTADTSTMTDAQLFAHYKATAPVLDLDFFVRTQSGQLLSPALEAQCAELRAQLLANGGKHSPATKAEWADIRRVWGRYAEYVRQAEIGERFAAELEWTVFDALPDDEPPIEPEPEPTAVPTTPAMLPCHTDYHGTTWYLNDVVTHGSLTARIAEATPASVRLVIESPYAHVWAYATDLVLVRHATRDEWPCAAGPYPFGDEYAVAS